MAIGSPGPGGRSPSDPDAFLLRSGARSGHKREFAFILRSQAESGLSRTRSGSRPPPPPKRSRRSCAADSGSDAGAADSGSDADAASDSEVSDPEDEDAAHAAKSGRKRGRTLGKRSIVDDSLLDSDLVSNSEFSGGNAAHAVKPGHALLDSVFALDAEFLGKKGGRGRKRGKRSIENSVATDVALLDSVISELDVELFVADQLPGNASSPALPGSAVSGPDANPCALPVSAFSEQCTEIPLGVDALTDSVAEPDAKPDSANSERDGNHSVAMDALPDSAVLELGAKSSVPGDALTGSPMLEQNDEPIASVVLPESMDSEPDALPLVVSNALPDLAILEASVIGNALPNSLVLEPSADSDALSDSAILEQDAKPTVNVGALLDSAVLEPVAEHVVALDDQKEKHVTNKAPEVVDGQCNVRSPVRTVHLVKGIASPGSPSRRFTRSLLKASMQSPVRAPLSVGEGGSAVETPTVGKEEELKISVDESAKGTVGVEIPVEGYSGSNSELPGVSLSGAGYGEAKKQSGSFTRTASKSSWDDRQIVLALPVCNTKGSVKVDSAPKKAIMRIMRSALKPPVIKQETPIMEAPTTKQDHKVDNGVVVKPMVRFTRSSIRPPIKPPPQVGDSSETESDTSEEETKSVRKPSRKTVKNKMELKMSKKIGLTKLPSNVRELLATGLLEGYPVKYKFGDKQVYLEGVIRGNAISCYCPSCNGSKSYSAYGFEVHAGSNKKHPSDYIVLENGKSLHDVLNACTSGPLNMLEAKIQNVIRASPRKRPSICQKCGESFRTSGTGEHALLCDSCHDVKYRKTRASLSNGTQRTLKTGSPADPSCSTSLSLSSQKKNNFGRITKKDVGLHKLVFMDDILPEGTEVAYYHHGKRLLDGYIKDSGIFCLHCDAVVKPSAFEAHAGRAQRRKPFHNIYTSNGVSLHELSVSLSKGRKLPTGENDDLCNKCNDGGDLLLCDVCPRAFHKGCVGLSEVPKGDWHCPPCQSMHQKEKYVESNDNAIAAGRVAGDDPIEQIIKRCIRIFTPPGTDVGGCTLCRLHDFSKAAFDERTVLICDQCEKEYHVGCLRDHDMCDLKELPEAEWFCCADCSRIHTALQELLLRGQEPLKDSDAVTIKKKHEEKGITKDDDIDVRWRLLSGKTASDDTDSKLLLADALSLFREAFDPIVGAATGRDLIPFIVNGEDMGDQDFGGMYCVVLTVNSAVVSAGILRILGCELAELPLAATSRESQGQGYFQSLFSCIERLLVSLNIKHFVLPAAEEAISIWTKKFGFTKMAPGELVEYAKGAHPMIFQGTTMLHKPVIRSGDSSAGD